MKRIFSFYLFVLFRTSNIAFRSSSRNRNGILDTCKRFCIVPDVVLPLVDDVPFDVIVLVDCGEWDDEEFDWALKESKFFHFQNLRIVLKHTFSLFINSFDDICCILLLVVVSIIDGDDGTFIISGRCDVESTTRLAVGLEILFVDVAIFAYTYGWCWPDDESVEDEDVT